jgi:hypothetical protein
LVFVGFGHGSGGSVVRPDCGESLDATRSSQ